MSHTPDAEPRLLPTPESVSGVDAPVTVLTTGWVYCTQPDQGFAAPDADVSDWAQITVPGEPSMQGFSVSSDVEAGYRLTLPRIVVPPQCRAVLRFDGVYNQARIWVNGHLARTHLGGFTRFECDVTAMLNADAENVLAVGVTDRSDSVSTASNYAFHCIGGILRPVSVLIVPETLVEELHVSTPVDEDGHPSLTLDLRLGGDHQDAELGVELTDPTGSPVDLGAGAAGIAAAPDGSVHVQFPVNDAELWSDENPALYDLRITVSGARPVSYRQRIGFRTVEVRGNTLLVNGRKTILRGVNRHDIDPALGRSSDGTLERRDLELFRAANINFVRTSHYPPHPALLEAADELGIYLEVENGVCWAGQFGWPATQDDPRFLAEYIEPLAEMIAVARNHASVIIWSIGNESTWGENFVRSHELVQSLDSSRPIIMSFEGGPEDILSSHYPAYGADLGSAGKPVLHDEVVHVPVYQSGDLRRDPGIHADWAVSIADFAERLHGSDGGLGIAIWSGVDEQFSLPGGIVGFGPWGLIDIWRRRKPEWWAVRSAFSPVRLGIAAGRAASNASGEVMVGNAYSTRRLSELVFEWRLSDGSTTRAAGPDVAPGEETGVCIPAGAVELAVIDGARVIDHRLLVSPGGHDTHESAIAAPQLTETEEAFVITGDQGSFRIEIDRSSGSIRRAMIGEQPVEVGGPIPSIEGIQLGPWSPEQVDVTAAEATVNVRVSGSSGPLRATFDLFVDGTGMIRLEYSLSMPAGGANGRILEAGMELQLGTSASVTEWVAGASGAIAGEEYLRRPRGRAVRDARPDPQRMGDEAASWNEVRAGSIDRSARDRWSKDFRAARTDVRRQIITDDSGAGIEVLLDGDHSTRLAPGRTSIAPSDARVRLVGAWEYREVEGGLNQGSSGIKDHRCDEPGGRAIVRFTGTAIDCIGALGPDLGIIDVRLDGQPVGEFDLFSPVDCSGHAIFSADDLADGEHELEFEVTGRHHPWSTAVGARLQGFDVFTEHPAVSLVALSRRNYPVSGSFDWMDPSVVQRAEDGVQVSGGFILRLLPAQV